MKRLILPYRVIVLATLFYLDRPASAATFTVTNLNDSGAGSLRDAITQANAASGDDTIVFTSGLTGTIQLQSVLPALSTNVYIQGPGNDLITVNRQTGGAYRVFTASKTGFPGPVVRIAGLRITGGNTPMVNPPSSFGGGIYMDYGQLTVENCTFAGNIAAYGGAIYIGSTGFNSGTTTSLTVTSCVFNGNHAMWKGGAIICTVGDDQAASLSVSFSTFSNNFVDNDAGGAIVNEAGNGSTSNATVGYCTFAANQVLNGGTSVGGAIENVGFRGSTATMQLTNSAFNSNTANIGGALYNLYNGNVTDSGSASLTVASCTFQNNGATTEAGAAENICTTNSTGASTATLGMSNCTLVGNSAPEGNALLNYGLGAATANLNVTACTLKDNVPSDGAGSGIFSRAASGGSSIVRVAGSIFASGVGTNLGANGGTISSSGYNLSTDNGSGYLTGQADQLNTDPKFDPAGLQDNGGQTKTIALILGSPAIDASQQFGLPTDQRGVGFQRPFDNPTIANAVNGNGADIGAFEVQGDPVQGGAPSFVVTTLDDHDDGVCGADCSLREAIARGNAVSGANTITFDPGLVGNLTMQAARGPFSVTDSTTITGPGARLLTISANVQIRVFTFSAGTSIVSGLTIRDGWVAASTTSNTIEAGGILNLANLTLNDCSISENRALAANAIGTGQPGGNARGGGIVNRGTLSLNRCVMIHNGVFGGNGTSASGDFSFGGAGGTAQGSAIFSDAGATLNVSDTTFYNNVANGGSGGSAAFGANGGGGIGTIFSQGTMDITAITMSGNFGLGGAGGSGNSLENSGVAGAGKGGLVATAGNSTVRNSIVAANTASGFSRSIDVDGAFTSQGYNLIGSANHSSGFTGAGDQTGTDAAQLNPQLGAFGNNGGPTDTFAILTSSPARDAGKSFSLTIDQRGFARTLDDPALANAVGGDGTDIGAFEADAPQTGASLVVTTANDHDDGLCGFNDCSLREAIIAANSITGDNVITFKPGVTGSISLGSTLPNITTNINIQGPGARILQVYGNDAYRVFSFTAGTSAMSGLTIANGRIPAAGTSGSSASGGGIFNQGMLTLFQCAVKNCLVGGSFNFGGNGGSGNGGGVFNSGVLSMNSCTVNDNRATGGGGQPGSRVTAGGRGGAANGGGLCNSGGTLTLSNCTISGNSAQGGSGGEGLGNLGGDGGNAYAGVYNSGTMTVTACTVSANSGTGGGGGSGSTNGSPGVSGGGIRTSGTATVRNTISAGNGGFDVIGAFTSQGYNLIGPLGTATGFTAAGDQTGVTNPVLGLLQNNGGPTDTIAPFLSPTLSPAIDKGNSFGLTTDQRGHVRIANAFNVFNAADGADIGAFELIPLGGSDTDGDTMPNDYETFYGLNPNNATDGGVDSDGDGLTNEQEAAAGTDPRDARSGLRVTAVGKNGNDFVVTFSLAVLGKSYRLERKDALTDSMWGSISGVTDFNPTSSGPGQFTDPNGGALPKHFYRVRVLP